MWFRKLWVIGLEAGAGVAPACSGDDDNDDNDDKDSNAGTGGSSSGGGGISCGVLSLDLVSSTLAMPGLEAPTETVSTRQTTCMYPEGSNSAKVIIAYLTGMDRASFDSEPMRAESSLGVATTDVAGLGEAAYSITKDGAVTTNSLAVLKGSTRFQMSSGATLDREKQLATQILGNP